MKIIIVFYAILFGIYAYPQKRKTTILYNDFKLNELGKFSFSYHTSDGIHHEAKGELKKVGTPEEALSVTGTYSYTGPDGNIYKVKYTADDRGFKPSVISVKKPVFIGGEGVGISDSCAASLCGTGIG